MEPRPDVAVAKTSDAEYVKDKWVDGNNYLSAFQSRCKEELEFTIDQAHWNDETTDSQRIQPTDVALMNLVRHQVSEITKAGQFFEARPVDHGPDPQASEYVKNALDQNINDVESCFEEVQEDWIVGGIAAGMWFVYTYHDDDDDEVRDCDLPPWRVAWTPGFKYPFRAPWMTIEFDLLPEDIKGRKGWKNTAEIVSDTEQNDAQNSSVSGTNQVFANNSNPAPGTTTTRYVKVVYLFEKGIKERIPKQTGFRTLPPEDAYMMCASCPYKSDPQAAYGDAELPDLAMCPECGGAMKKMTLEPVSEDILAYRKGKRLTIAAVNQSKVFWQGGWPDDTRNFPISAYSGYSHPTKPVPNSETFYYRPLACISDAMLRLGYEQQRKAHGIILAPQDGLFDAYGQDFAFSEHQDVAYYDPAQVMGGQSVQWFQPQGLNSAWSTYFNSIQAIFVRNQGPFASGLGPAESKDIAVGTINTLVETGNIPMDHKIRRFQRAKSRWLTRRWEIMRSRYGSRRWIKIMGPAGVEAMHYIRLSAIPAYDIVVTAEPKIAKEELELAIAFRDLALSVPPGPIRRIMFRAAKIPASWIAELEREEAKQQMMLQAVSPNGTKPTNRLAAAPAFGAPVTQ